MRHVVARGVRLRRGQLSWRQHVKGGCTGSLHSRFSSAAGVWDTREHICQGGLKLGLTTLLIADHRQAENHKPANKHTRAQTHTRVQTHTHTSTKG